MKKLFLLLTIALLVSAQSSFAAQKEFVGYLKTGGICRIKIENQNDYLHQLIFTTSKMTIRVTNISLDNGHFESFEETFERSGNYYEQVFFSLPIMPRMYDIKMKNLGRGKFLIEKTTVIYGVSTYTSRDVCITK